MDDPQELLDIIDEAGNTIGPATKEFIYQNLHPHRIVDVFVFDREGRILLQKRSIKKHSKPLHWISSASGHVKAGESFEDAARREAAEEIGKDLVLERVNTHWFTAEHSGSIKKLITIFKTVDEGPFAIDPDEVDMVQFFSFDEIIEMIKRGERIHPELLFILEKEFDFPSIF